MAKPVTLQREFTRVVRDVSREQLPKGACWDLIDYIPNVIGSPIRKRGGWSHGSAAFGAGTYAAAVAYADYTAGSKLITINDAGTAFSVNLSTLAVTSLGTAVVPYAKPVMHRDLLVVPGNDGATAPKSINTSGTIAALSGTAPNGIYPTVYKDRTVLARDSSQPQRVYFGPAGAPSGTWDTTNSYIDASFPVTGLAAFRNAILVFGNGRTERIRGSTPPPSSDMVKEPLFNMGCIDARSISYYGDSAIFANQEGVWITDGAVPENLTKSGGFLTYYIDLMDDWASTWTLAGEVYRGNYYLSIMDGSTFKDCLVCDLDRRGWRRDSNIKALMMTRSLGQAEEFYWARRDTPRLAKGSSMFSPSSSVINDADGTAVTGVYESGFFAGAPATKKRVHDVYVDYALVAASTAATLTVAYVTSPEATSYTSLSPTLVERAAVGRVRVPARFAARGVGLKITQTNASDDTRIHEIAGDITGLEESR